MPINLHLPQLLGGGQPNVWYIYLHLVDFYGTCKYTIHGSCGVSIRVIFGEVVSCNPNIKQGELLSIMTPHHQALISRILNASIRDHPTPSLETQWGWSMSISKGFPVLVNKQITI